MASLPPLQLEDTDEDFFDKLVEDDDIDFTGTRSNADVPDTNDSKEVEVLANLSISELIPTKDDPFRSFDVGLKANDTSGSVDEVALGSDCAENNSVINDCITSTTGNGVTRHDASMDDSVASTIEVKEVDWSVFSSDSQAHSSTSVFGSYSDFFTELEVSSSGSVANIADKVGLGAQKTTLDSTSGNSVTDAGTISYGEHQVEAGQYNAQSVEQTIDGQDLSGGQSWENQYPGWRFDSSTGQWHQLESYDATVNMNADFHNSQYSIGASAGDGSIVMDHKSDVYHSQQDVKSVSGTVGEAKAIISSSVFNSDSVSQGTVEYPAHMIFDPQYPGWYYDAISQEWKSLETYAATTNEPTTTDYLQPNQSSNVSPDEVLPQNSYSSFNKYEEAEHFVSHNLINTQGQDVDWDGSFSNYSQGNVQMWQQEPVAVTNSGSETLQYNDLYTRESHINNSTYQLTGFSLSEADTVHESSVQGLDATIGSLGFQQPATAGSFPQLHYQASTKQSKQLQFSPAYFDSQHSGSFSSQAFQSGLNFSYAHTEGRSSAGRPPHALVTFGFGGKLIVMKEDNSFGRNGVYGGQDVAGGTVSVLNLMEVVMDKAESWSNGTAGYEYFHALCKQSYPGPLVGGSAGIKELNKWIDDRIANRAHPNMHHRENEASEILFALLKVSCQFYGKLRSPLGSDPILKEDSPESVVANLFASTKRNGSSFSGYGSIPRCMQNLPSEGQIQATALEVEKLLVTGRKKEALECAQQGQLWGPALVLASQLGDQFYGESVRQMALSQLVAGSPLRTLCLLIAGKPVDVFPDTSNMKNLPGKINLSQQPMQTGSKSMLDDWEDNLAMITANRTKDDELVIIHLGDCLWKERGEVTAAHICYLVAEANFESYSDSARFCLVGADHLRSPRTYASPEAIQMTELYEYSKVLGNSQFTFFPFQPYKYVYALMLAEAGKLSDSLKYCQAIMKSLKTGRGPEVDTWKHLVSLLEERIRTHQQGGYGSNAPTKFVGKLFNLLDSTAHRVVGGLPPPAPSSTNKNLPPLPSSASSSSPPVLSSAYSSSPPVLSSTYSSSHAMPSLTSSSSPPVLSSAYSSSPPVLSSTYSSSLPVPSSTNTSLQHNYSHFQGNNESTMAMSTLMPSSSMEPIRDWGSGDNQMLMPNRSVSEPDFGKPPHLVDSPKEVMPSERKANAPVSGGSSRFGRFGSQIFQKTFGLVLKSRPGRQAKLGEANKFYYDEKLKQWVEEGAEAPPEEAALPPPPTVAAFHSGSSDNITKSDPSDNIPKSSGPEIKSQNSSEQSPRMPPIPSGSNQFSARGRMGVRSRYVDTFNKGGGTSAKLFQSPPIPAAKSSGGANSKFFVPSPMTSSSETPSTEDSLQKAIVTSESTPVDLNNDSSTSPSPTLSSSLSMPMPMPIQRFPSMDNIVQQKGIVQGSDDSFHSQSRRAASWSGNLNDAKSNPSNMNNAGKASSMSHPPFIPGGHPSSRLSMSGGGSSSEDLHEVAL